MSNPLQRVELLLGEEAVDRLKHICVGVVGVGGVGSYAAEALARTGVGKLILVDKDKVDITNLNRQIEATKETVGTSKVEAMKNRINSFSDCQVECIDAFYDNTINAQLVKCDYIIDAIDTISSKFDLIEFCHQQKIPCISSLGMANRLDPSMVKVTTLDKTEGDPLAKACRMMAKKRNIDYKINVVFSNEQPVKQNQIVDEMGKTRKDRIPPASLVFVPASAGLLCASVVVKNLLNLQHKNVNSRKEPKK